MPREGEARAADGKTAARLGMTQSPRQVTLTNRDRKKHHKFEFQTHCTLYLNDTFWLQSPARRSPGCQGRETQRSLKQVRVPASAPQQSTLGKGLERTLSERTTTPRVAKCTQTKSGRAGLESSPEAKSQPVRGTGPRQTTRCCPKQKKAPSAQEQGNLRPVPCVRPPAGCQGRVCLSKARRGLQQP